MNIAITSFYLPSVDKIGVGYQAHAMANALVRNGNGVTMYSPAVRCSDALYSHVQVDAGSRFRMHGFASSMQQQDLTAFDVLHSHGGDHLLRESGVPCHIRTVHGSCFEEAWHIRGMKNRLRMLCLAMSDALACRIADRAVAVSANTKSTYPWIRKVIPNGVDGDCFHPGEKEQLPVILFVGTYNNRKRGKWLMEIFAREIRPRVPTARLWMVCSDAPRSDGVEVLGKLSSDELAERFRRAWVFCLPSTYEGFGVPYIEAMASGTAVVATKNVGALEVLEGGKWGAIANDEKLSEVIVGLLINPVKRRQLESVGLIRAERYKWASILREYKELYSDVLIEKNLRRFIG